MLIDWFTVGAQALNFVVLVWLMKRFLYKPILAAIDARQKQIASQLTDSEAKEVAASSTLDEYRAKSAELARNRAAAMADAVAAAGVERTRLIEQARQAALTLGAQLRETTESDARRMNRAIAQRCQAQVLALTRQALTALAACGLEERMTEMFCGRLRELAGKPREDFAQGLASSLAAPLVRSAWELAPAQRRTLQAALDESFSGSQPCHFETAPSLICGIELTVDGQRLCWSLSDYLSCLEGKLADPSIDPVDTRDRARAVSEQKAALGALSEVAHV